MKIFFVVILIGLLVVYAFFWHFEGNNKGYESANITA